MIRAFRHRGLERFFLTGSKKGIVPAHAARWRLTFAFEGTDALLVDYQDYH